MKYLISFVSVLTGSYSCGVLTATAIMSAFPPILICVVLLNARLRYKLSNPVDDMLLLTGIFLGAALTFFLIWMTAFGMLRRIGLKAWFRDLRLLNRMVRGTHLISQEEFLVKVYDRKAAKHNRKKKNKDDLRTLSTEMSESEKERTYRRELVHVLKAVSTFPRRFGILTIVVSLLVITLGIIFTGLMLQEHETVTPISLIAVGYYSAFLFISFELNTGALRTEVKKILNPEINEHRFTLRFKFAMQFLIIILSILSLYIMMIENPGAETLNEGLDLGDFIQFIAIVVAISVYLIYLYISSIMRTLREIAAAVNSLGQGGDGRLYLSGLDREFTNLGNDYIRAANEVTKNRNSLHAEIEKKKSELDAATAELMAKDKEVQTELDMASDIQGGLYPQTRAWRDLRFAYFYRPMEKVSGDFFDIFDMPNEKCGVLMADVSGHGVPAALITTMAKLAFGAKTQLYDMPAEILELVNKDLQAHVKTQDYMTAFFCVFEDDYRFYYANASHQKAILLRKEGTFEELDTKGIFLGADELLFASALNDSDAIYEQKEAKLEPGDRLILFTDGITEMRDRSGEEFGNERLIEYMTANMNKPVETVNREFYEHFFNFIDNDNINDDITIMLLERVPPSTPTAKAAEVEATAELGAQA